MENVSERLGFVEAFPAITGATVTQGGEHRIAVRDTTGSTYRVRRRGKVK